MAKDSQEYIKRFLSQKRENAKKYLARKGAKNAKENNRCAKREAIPPDSYRGKTLDKPQLRRGFSLQTSLKGGLIKIGNGCSVV
jgi:hypothetical protein